MLNKWSMICVIGVIYTLFIVVTCYKKGILHLLWPLLLLVGVAYSGWDLTVVNKNWIPEWIFQPGCLLVSPVIALIFVIVLRLERE